MFTEQEAKEMLGRLTSKHREVLDLVNEHNSNKEVARRLGLALTTIDYRLKSVRILWDTDGRNSTMRLYNELRVASGIAPTPALPLDALPDRAPEQDLISRLHSSPLESDGPVREGAQLVQGPDGRRRFTLEEIDANYGALGRAMLILFIALAIIAFGAGSLFIAVTLSRLL